MSDHEADTGADALETARILVAEDDPHSRDMLVRRLARRGYAVDAVTDGVTCLQHIDAHPPDLLLLDIQMPQMTGLEVLRAARARFSHDALPVILVTALGDSEDVVRGLEAGANDYVVKPINLPVLLARMHVALRITQSVRLLMEAERQRVLISALGEACHQLSQPSQAVIMTLDGLIRHPPKNSGDLSTELRSVQSWIQQVADVIHRMQAVGTLRPLPYTQRIKLLDSGTGSSEGKRPGS